MNPAATEHQEIERPFLVDAIPSHLERRFGRYPKRHRSDSHPDDQSLFWAIKGRSEVDQCGF